MEEFARTSRKLKRSQWLNPIQYKISELEIVLGLGATKLREMIDQGILQSYKIDGTLFVHHDDAVAFVERYRKMELDQEDRFELAT